MFGFGKPHFLGIDFGTASIKAVELSIKDSRPVLINYAQVSLEDTLGKRSLPKGRSFDDEIVLHLRALLSQMKPKSDSAYVAMPAFTGLISLVEFPRMDEEELKEAVRFEAHKYIPSALEDIALSWEVVNVRSIPNDGEKMEVLLVAALNKEVAHYEYFTKEAGLKLSFLELETFSLARSIVGDEEGLFLVIDIGSRATNLILVENGAVKMSRNIDGGGRDITRALAEGLNITTERAETLKKSGKDFLFAPESALSFPSLQAIAGEAGRMLASYQLKHSGVQCKQIFLSGGVASFTGLAEYYTNILKTPVVKGDPWRNVNYTPHLAENIKELGTSYSVAIGLALCGTETLLKKKKNLTPESKKPFSLKDVLTKKL